MRAENTELVNRGYLPAASVGRSAFVVVGWNEKRKIGDHNCGKTSRRDVLTCPTANVISRFSINWSLLSDGRHKTQFSSSTAGRILHR